MKNYIKQLIMERARLKKANAKLIEENTILRIQNDKLDESNTFNECIVNMYIQDINDLNEQNRFLLKQLNEKELEPIKF